MTFTLTVTPANSAPIWGANAMAGTCTVVLGTGATFSETLPSFSDSDGTDSHVISITNISPSMSPECISVSGTDLVCDCADNTFADQTYAVDIQVLDDNSISGTNGV